MYSKLFIHMKTVQYGSDSERFMFTTRITSFCTLLSDLHVPAKIQPAITSL